MKETKFSWAPSSRPNQSRSDHLGIFPSSPLLCTRLLPTTPPAIHHETRGALAFPSPRPHLLYSATLWSEDPPDLDPLHRPW
jgi:hypothetical protein